jgi:hypothetical protein
MDSRQHKDPDLMKVLEYMNQEKDNEAEASRKLRVYHHWRVFSQLQKESLAPACLLSVNHPMSSMT